MAICFLFLKYSGYSFVHLNTNLAQILRVIPFYKNKAVIVMQKRNNFKVIGFVQVFHNNIRLLLSLVFLLLSFSLFSQEYSYRHYTVKDGLIQNQVIAMFQDSKGYLWLGTKGGVSRFDGKEFRIT